MRRWILLLFLAGTAAFPPRPRGAPAPAGRIDPEPFLSAQRLYDEGRFEEAAAIYRGEIASGRATAQAWYNLGNARYRMGDLGGAALAYQRAGRLRPRDPDIRANLRQTRRMAGAVIEPDPRPFRLAARLTPREWAVLAWAAYALSFALLCLPGLRRAARRLVPAGFAAALAAASGAGLHFLAERNPQMVVLPAEGVVARFAPLPDSAPHFSLPPASIVRRTGRNGGWIRIRLGRSAGWIPADSAETVAPETGREAAPPPGAVP